MFSAAVVRVRSQEGGVDVNAAASVAAGSGAGRYGGSTGISEGNVGDGVGAWGRPWISPAQLALVTVLQFAENLTASGNRSRIGREGTGPAVGLTGRTSDDQGRRAATHRFRSYTCGGALGQPAGVGLLHRRKSQRVDLREACSDVVGEFGEGRAESSRRVSIDAEFLVAAAQVLTKAIRASPRLVFLATRVVVHAALIVIAQ